LRNGFESIEGILRVSSGALGGTLEVKVRWKGRSPFENPVSQLIDGARSHLGGEGGPPARFSSSGTGGEGCRGLWRLVDKQRAGIQIPAVRRWCQPVLWLLIRFRGFLPTYAKSLHPE